MNDFYMQAEFMGESGDFAHGSVYVIHVYQAWFGKIVIAPCHGNDNKEMPEYRQVYRNLYAFFANWKPLGLQTSFVRDNSVQ